MPGTSQTEPIVQKTRIAAVRYFNTLPLIEGLETVSQLALDLCPPSEIASRLRSTDEHERADIGLVSFIDTVREEGLAVLPAGAIGCFGPTMTVRIFARNPDGPIETLHADVESHTSVVLAQVVLAETTGVRPTIVPFAAPEDPTDADWPDAVLLIGDKVARKAPPANDFPRQIDLGEAWKAMTGLPFVYAAWACDASRADDPLIATACALLDRQRRRNAARLDHIASTHAERMRWDDAEARHYIGSLLRYELTPEDIEGAERFVQMAAALDLCPDRPINWIDPAARPVEA
ncbi:MAG: hypothetical protein CMJ31_14555 [Phycisphaerae bacterium]|nr:hypothetical protein [Phycisphaerae bacterium]